MRLRPTSTFAHTGSVPLCNNNQSVASFFPSSPVMVRRILQLKGSAAELPFSFQKSVNPFILLYKDFLKDFESVFLATNIYQYGSLK